MSLASSGDGGALDRQGPQEASDRIEPGDEGSEHLYQDEFDADRVEV